MRKSKKTKRRIPLKRLALMMLRPILPDAPGAPKCYAATVEILAPFSNPIYCWGVCYRDDKGKVVRHQSCANYLNCLQAIIDTVRVD